MERTFDRAYWCASIDSYCERTDAGFWSEPINAWSNLAFIAAAIFAFRLWHNADGRDKPVLALIAITTSVGVGSFLFHTFANRWSLLADVVPITIFILVYFGLAMRRYFGFGLGGAVAMTIAFQAASLAFGGLWKLLIGPAGVDPVNGSAGYFPAALALIAIGFVLVMPAMRVEDVLVNVRNARWAPMSPTERRQTAMLRVTRREAVGRALLVAAAVFAVSLLFRSIDLAVCGFWDIGTHFLWHTLNGLLLFLLMRAAIRHGPRNAVP